MNADRWQQVVALFVFIIFFGFCFVCFLLVVVLDFSGG